jgi:hypothetical protein
MTQQELRDNFDRLASNLRNAGMVEEAAKAELLKEYYTNAEFRAALEKYDYTATA